MTADFDGGAATDPWPLHRLVLRTPRLELRPDDDAGLVELAAAAAAGVHNPDRMPFSVPWTDAPAAELGRNTLQFYWRQRAELRPDEWHLNFLVRLDGHVIGTQALSATGFATSREVSSGSWLTRSRHGRGYGTEMRAAVLMLAFDRLGAVAARSGAFSDNLPAQGVSRRLGYPEDGTATTVVRGRRVTEIRYRMDAADLVRPDWTLRVDGLEPCLPLLGLTPDA